VGENRVGQALATALLFGIRTDTDSLMRGVSPADVEAYAFLQERADLQLIRRFEQPSYAPEVAIAFGRALKGIRHDGDLCVAWLGEMKPADIYVLADLADFCLAIEQVTWVAVASVLEGDLVLTLRHSGGEPGAGEVARRIADRGGVGGGHTAMARVTIPCDAVTEVMGEAADADMAAAVQRLVRQVLDEATGDVSRPESRPVHQV
jgi:nanoRNase/pAp phosphatase (c-di-AMP/oligoRNAs hydrolase)